MTRSWFLLGVLALLTLAGRVSAQTYEFRHGYVFEQPYVQRVTVRDAEEAAQTPGLFTPLLNFDWTRKPEQIHDARVQRVGNRLVLHFDGKAWLSLQDYATKRGDGEFQRFKYLMRMAGFHIVGVEYGHDQPQFLLIADTGRPIYFVNTN
ncbi:MAG: hypothetical protein U1E84_12600 [Rhodoferax sp.]